MMMTFVLEFKIYKKIKSEIMGNLLYLVAIILIIAWAAGYFAFNAGYLIHILLVIAIIVILLRVISGQKPI